MGSTETIRKLGLNENQSNVYIAILQMGSGGIQDIARKASVKRTTTYSILDNLVQQGLVNFSQKGAHREYFAENPKKIPNLLDRKEMEIREQKINLVEYLPELLSMYNANSAKPTVRTYEGVEGIKTVFEETLTLKRGEEMLAYASYQTVKGNLSEFIKNYIARRVKRGITQRCIVEDSAYSREDLIKNDRRDLRETRLVNKDKFPFEIDQICIYSNKMFIASYKELFAVVIESATLVNTQRAIFELAWAGAKTVGK